LFFFYLSRSLQPPPISTLFPYTTLFRSTLLSSSTTALNLSARSNRTTALKLPLLPPSGTTCTMPVTKVRLLPGPVTSALSGYLRSEEHTSELQSRVDLVCRLLLEKRKSL